MSAKATRLLELGHTIHLSHRAGMFHVGEALRALEYAAVEETTA